MKKILIVLVVLIGIVAAGLFFLAGNLDKLIAETIEKEGTAALGSKVSVANVVTSLSDGSAAINGLTIANPPGYTKPSAISLGSFSAKVDYANQLVEEIIIDQPTINAEINGTKSNFQDLLSNMPESAEEVEEEAASEQSDFEITIKRLQLSKATVNLLASNFQAPAGLNLGDGFDLGNHSFVMDDFILNNINGTVDEVTNEITTKLVAHVSSQVQGFVKEKAQEIAKAKLAAELKEAVEEKREELKNKLNEKLGDNVNLDGKLDDDTKKKVGEKLKGLKLKF